MSDNTVDLYLEKYGLKAETPLEIIERKETYSGSALCPGTILSKEKLRKRKKEKGNETSSRVRQSHSTNERVENSRRSHKYFSKSTRRLNFSVEKKTYLEHKKSSKYELNNQTKKNYLRGGLPIVKILNDDRVSERKGARERDGCSAKICQTKMEMLRKVPGTQNEAVNGDAFGLFPEKHLKRLQTLCTFNKKKCDRNNNALFLDTRMKDDCSESKKVLKSEEKTAEKDEIYYNMMKELLTAKGETRSIHEDEYDSRGEDSEDDKQTVIFEEKLDTMRKLTESLENVGEQIQQHLKTNIKGGKLKSPRRLKQRKLSLVRIITNEKRVIRKKLGKPTRKIRRKVAERQHFERSGEITIKDKNFVEEFGDDLVEVSTLVKRLHDTLRIITHLKNDMEGKAEIAEHFKTVIETQQENYRKEISRNQKTIMEGYTKMMSLCKKPGDVTLEISKRTSLSVDDVKSVLSHCMLLENTLETLTSTNKSDEIIPKEKENQEMSTSFEKGRCVGSTGIVPAVESSDVTVKELHSQRIFQSLNPLETHRKSNDLNSKVSSAVAVNPVSFPPSARHLAFPSFPSKCSTSVQGLVQRQVVPPRVATGGHSSGFVLCQNQEPNYLSIPYQNPKRSQSYFINQERVQQNSFAMTGFPPENQRCNFVQYGKPLEQQFFQSGKNLNSHILSNQIRHGLKQHLQQRLTENCFQYPTSGLMQRTSSVQRPPQPENVYVRLPAPCMSQPPTDTNSTRDQNHCHQQQVLGHRLSVQGRNDRESNFAVPFNSVTRDGFNRIKPSWPSFAMMNNPVQYTTTGQTSIYNSNPLLLRNSMSAREVNCLRYLPQPRSRVPNISNMSSTPVSTPVRPQMSMSQPPRLLQNLLSVPPNTNGCILTTEIESRLNVPSSVQPAINKFLPSVRTFPQSSNPLNLNPLVAEQRQVTNTNEEGFKETDDSVLCSPYTIPAASIVQRSKGEADILDPTVPQKLTMKNQRLQAGDVLIKSVEVNKSQSQPDDGQTNTAIKVQNISDQEHEEKTKMQVTGNSSRKYECAQNGCKRSGIRICNGCESVIYCSGICQISHWRLKHREECSKLRELRC